jgi:ABC-type nitrate/sulfonate/bicarbonate transport system permease component
VGTEGTDPMSVVALERPRALHRPSRSAVMRGMAIFGKILVNAFFSLLIVLAVWEIFILATNIDSFVARNPLDVWHYLFTQPDAAAHRSELWEASLITLRDAALGYIFGTLAAIGIALVFVLRRSVEQALMPIAMTLRSVPLVAMTPLIALMFGRGLTTVAVIAGIVTFFPTLVNLVFGLRSVPASAFDLLHAYGASPRTTLVKLQLPCALPSLFASARIAAPGAIIGALLAEWLATGKGLGYMMLQSVTTFQLDRLWAAVAIVTLFSVVLYNIINVIEQSVLSRYAPDRVSGDPVGL